MKRRRTRNTKDVSLRGSTHRLLKLHAAAMDIPVNELVEQWVTEALDQDGAPPPPSDEPPPAILLL